MAVHDSELTRALESLPATGATPTGTGTTSNQWWLTQWHYFVMPETVEEALRSDGTAFAVVTDTNISAGGLLVAFHVPVSASCLLTNSARLTTELVTGVSLFLITQCEVGQ